jgi:hypothetical protein
MNIVLLTKISKFFCLGSASAYVAFSSKSNPLLHNALGYLVGGLIVLGAIALLWEGRSAVEETATPENQISALLNPTATSKPKRDYLLSPIARLEIVIGLLVFLVGIRLGSL